MDFVSQATYTRARKRTQYTSLVVASKPKTVNIFFLFLPLSFCPVVFFKYHNIAILSNQIILPEKKEFL